MAFLETNDGTQLFYTDAGSGPPVVLMASAWLSSAMWDFQVPTLVDHGLRCITYDRRGHGRSDRPWAGYDYNTLADDLAALLQRLEIREATLVAHSMAAGEAVRYLTRHGAARISRLALVCGTTPFPMKTPDNPEGIDRALMEADLAVRTADRPKWFADNADAFFGVGLTGISVSPEFVQYMIRQCLDCSARAATAVFLTGFTSDLRSEMQAVPVPTLIIHGDHDAQAPLDLCGRKAACLIPDNTLLVYEDAAHGLFVTHAERLTADLLSFVVDGGRRPHGPVPSLAVQGHHHGTAGR